jgi:D-sedoheptulose 7-phosphate isomerase
MSFIEAYLSETSSIARNISHHSIKKVLNILIELRNNKGRLFCFGNGGGASISSHAVNDFRKITEIETYCPENIPEITARSNDDGFDTVLMEWLRINKLNSKDCLLIFSVGGGNEEKNISTNIVRAVKYGERTKCKIISIVGKVEGYVQSVSDACIIIPIENIERLTPHAESWQSNLLHLLVSHPLLKKNQTTWESVSLYEE